MQPPKFWESKIQTRAFKDSNLWQQCNQLLEHLVRAAWSRVRSRQSASVASSGSPSSARRVASLASHFCRSACACRTRARAKVCAFFWSIYSTQRHPGSCARTRHSTQHRISAPAAHASACFSEHTITPFLVIEQRLVDAEHHDTKQCTAALGDCGGHTSSCVVSFSAIAACNTWLPFKSRVRLDHSHVWSATAQG